LTTPTSVTIGKSWPLATICRVPTGCRFALRRSKVASDFSRHASPRPRSSQATRAPSEGKEPTRRFVSLRLSVPSRFEASAPRAPCSRVLDRRQRTHGKVAVVAAQAYRRLAAGGGRLKRHRAVRGISHTARTRRRYARREAHRRLRTGSSPSKPAARHVTIDNVARCSGGSASPVGPAPLVDGVNLVTN
jgi:hypothetical protein